MDFKCSNASLVADNERGNLTSVATLLLVASFCLEESQVQEVCACATLSSLSHFQGLYCY
jgi:hypothetical protein